MNGSSTIADLLGVDYCVGAEQTAQLLGHGLERGFPARRVLAADFVPDENASEGFAFLKMKAVESLNLIPFSFI